MSPTDIVDCYLQSSAKTTGCVCLRQIAPASQPPVPRTTAVSSHGHLSVRGYDDNDDEDEDDGDDIYTG